MNTQEAQYFNRKMAETKADPARLRKQAYRRLLRAIREEDKPARMTKPGYALLPTFKAGRNVGGSVTYQMTPREVARRKARRNQQGASRRANRA